MRASGPVSWLPVAYLHASKPFRMLVRCGDPKDSCGVSLQQSCRDIDDDAPADNLLFCIDPVMEVVQGSVMLNIYRHLRNTQA